jgi:hypothetical protein
MSNSNLPDLTPEFCFLVPIQSTPPEREKAVGEFALFHPAPGHVSRHFPHFLIS